MQNTLDDLNKSVTDKPGGLTDITPDEIAPVSADQESADHNRLFVERFATRLNQAGLSKDPIGVVMLGDGAVEGFRDLNNNRSKDGGEATLFKIELDKERNRLIATDTQNNHHRSSGYHMGGGFFTGYLLGSMLGRQHYSGVQPNRFSNMKMSDNRYRQTAAAKTRPSARSAGGSRSFKSGK
jgi:hypothetical protein